MPDDWWLMFLPVVFIFGDTSFVADVIASHKYHPWLLPMCSMVCVLARKQIYLPVVSSMRFLCEVDVIAPYWCGWCYCLCSLCLMLLPCGRCYATTLTLLQLQFRDVIQNPIPYVKHMVLADISIKGWIVHSDVNSCLMTLVTFWSSLPNNAEIWNSGIMTLWCYGGHTLERGPIDVPETSHQKNLDDSPIYSSSLSTLWHFNL